MIIIKHESHVAYGTANISRNDKLMPFIMQDDSVVFLKSCHFGKLPYTKKCFVLKTRMSFVKLRWSEGSEQDETEKV